MFRLLVYAVLNTVVEAFFNAFIELRKMATSTCHEVAIYYFLTVAEVDVLSIQHVYEKLEEVIFRSKARGFLLL